MKNFWKSGDPFIWITGGALTFSLLMIGGLLFLIMAKGLGFFWPSDIAEVQLENATKLLGQITAREKIPQPGAPPGTPERYRIQLQVGNRDIYGLDFRWVNEDEIATIDYPRNAVLLERREWGNMELWIAIKDLLPQTQDIYKTIKRIEKKDIGDCNYKIEKLRLDIRKLELQGGDQTSMQANIKSLEDKIIV